MSHEGFTKGPWTYEPDDRYGLIAADDEKGREWIICDLSPPADLVCNAAEDLSQELRDRIEANAWLIAAAPDLIEPAPDAADILEQYAEYIRGVKADELERHPYLPMIEDTARALRAAIAKATGQTNMSHEMGDR